jgi:hypothetical protein
MRTVLACAVAMLTLASCKKESPAGTVVKDWSYEGWSDADANVASLNPPKIVSQDVEWPAADAPPVRLHFETEIGDELVTGTHWHTPRHVRITLAQPTAAKMPTVECMPAPPGNKLEHTAQGLALVHPLGADGKTPIGVVGCFFSAKEPGNVVFDVDGDGHVTRTTAGKP